MHVCLLSLEWPPFGCGIGTYMYNLARGLVELGHEVTVVSHDQSPQNLPGVDVVQVPYQNGRRTLTQRLARWTNLPCQRWSNQAGRVMRKLSATRHFDIIETAEFGAWARGLIGWPDVPVVVRCHNPSHVVWSINNVGLNRLKMPLWLKTQDRWERRQTWHAQAICSPSESLANHLSLSWVIPRSRFTIIPNPIDAEAFCPDSDLSTGSKNNEILYVGRLDYNKGCYDLGRSLTELLACYPDIRVRFVGMDCPAPATLRGCGTTASQVIRTIVPLKYRHRIHFTSHVPVQVVADYYRQALCSIMPTRGFENFPYTTLEPMACGCPVVATRCGGPSEIITPDVDGLLVEPGDVAGLTAAISKLLDQPKLAQGLAQQGRKTITTRFADKVVIPKIVQFYEQIIGKHRHEPIYQTQQTPAQAP